MWQRLETERRGLLVELGAARLRCERLEAKVAGLAERVTVGEAQLAGERGLVTVGWCSETSLVPHLAWDRGMAMA